MNLFLCTSGNQWAVVRAVDAAAASRACATLEAAMFKADGEDDVEDFVHAWTAVPMVADGEPEVIATWWYLR